MDTLLRHWTMLRLVPRHPRKVSTADLEERLTDRGYPTTRRTIQRDLDKLSMEFPLISDGNKPSGWSWQADAELFDVPGMDTTAALTFCMVESFLSHMLPKGCLAAISPHMKQAHRVLGQLEGSSLQHWPSKVRTVQRTQPLLAAEIHPDVMETVYESLFHDRQFVGEYCRRGDTEPSEYVVNPLGLVFADPVIYLVATLRDYEDVLLLALHRFSSARMLEDGCRHTGDFDLDAYLEQGALEFPVSDNAEKISLKFRMGSYIAQHLQESPLSEDQIIVKHDEDTVLVESTVHDTQQLRWWLLGFGSQVEVLEPTDLRNEFLRTVKEMSALYGDNN
jgi:predicted DNA-binding transcriptional regulator YafY